MRKSWWYAIICVGGATALLAATGPLRRKAEPTWPSDERCPKIGAEPAGKWLCYDRSDHAYIDLRTGARDDCFAKGEVPAPDWCPHTTTITLGAPQVQSVETDDAGVTTIRFSGTATQTDDR